MGLTTGNFPPVDPATFMQTPYRERIKTLSNNVRPRSQANPMGHGGGGQGLGRPGRGSSLMETAEHLHSPA